MAIAYYQRTAGGIDLLVRLTPRGGADRIDGVVADASNQLRIAARVRAVPEKGAANDALVRLLAKACGVGISSVSLTGGHTGRNKTVAVRGDTETLLRRLEQSMTGRA